MRSAIASGPPSSGPSHEQIRADRVEFRMRIGHSCKRFASRETTLENHFKSLQPNANCSDRANFESASNVIDVRDSGYEPTSNRSHEMQTVQTAPGVAESASLALSLFCPLHHNYSLCDVQKLCRRSICFLLFVMTKSHRGCFSHFGNSNNGMG
jgi:hypothetical protein